MTFAMNNEVIASSQSVSNVKMVILITLTDEVLHAK